MDFDVDDSARWSAPSRWSRPKRVEMKSEFILISPVFGEVPLKAKTWSEVRSELNDGWANSGKKKVVQRTYKLITEETRDFDTDY